MLTFLYCLDENYNTQALVSINSLLQNIDEKIDIILLHKDPSSFDGNKNKLKLENNKNLNSIQFIKFNNKNIHFPNLEDSHVSEATYYRLYISEHLNSYKNLIYLDPDIVCVNNPALEIKKQINLLNNSEFTIAAFTETVLNQNNKKEFKRLLVSGNKLFNAGFLIIDFQKWNDNNLGSLLSNRLNEIYDNILYWDQDVLNSYFNSNYLPLETKFNYMVSYQEGNPTREKIQQVKNNNLFIHYSGKSKPWTVSGVFDKHSIFYQKMYFNLTKDYYHIQNNWKQQALIDLMKSMKNLKILRIKRPISLIFYTFKFILKRRG